MKLLNLKSVKLIKELEENINMTFQLKSKKVTANKINLRQVELDTKLIERSKRKVKGFRIRVGKDTMKIL